MKYMAWRTNNSGGWNICGYDCKDGEWNQEKAESVCNRLNNDGWISIKKALPDLDEFGYHESWVLCHNIGEGDYIFIGTYDKDGFHPNDTAIRNIDVDFWQELLDEPK